MLGLSPAQLRVAADCAMLGPPSAPAARPADNNTAVSLTQIPQQRITSPKQQQIYNEKWSTKLPFRGICPASVGCVEFDDILDFCRIDHMFKGLVFRFPSDLYPPTSQGLAKLKQELVAAAKLRGKVDLVSNGCSNASNFENLTTEPQPCYRLVCNCKLIFQTETNKLNKENGKVNQSIEYKKSTLQNDRLNDRTRKDDEKLAPKTSTCRRKSKDDPMCPFTLPLFVDKHGFLLKIGLGNPNHQYHARAEVNKESRVRSSIISGQQREELRDVDRAHLGKSAACNRQCRETLEHHGNTACPCNHGLSQEVYDSSIDDDGVNDSDARYMCDVVDHPSPRKKPKTVENVQAYEAINPHVAELCALLDDAAADEETIAFFKEKCAKLTALARTMLTAD